VKIQYASDLHIEFPQNARFLRENPIAPTADILLLAGDIVSFAHQEKADWFFDYLSKNFKQTYWVAGNHEYYNSDINCHIGTFNVPIRENVHLVNNITVNHEDVNFIFSTLWTKIHDLNLPVIKHKLNDYHLIRDGNEILQPQKTTQFFEENIAFIASELKRLQDEKTVVITHHVPTQINYPEQFRGDVLTDAFVVELFDLIEELKPNAWIYGHSHHSQTKFQIGKTILLNNALGYVHSEKTKYQSNRTIRV
jgi:Icc-related predicted phosphoesterase